MGYIGRFFNRIKIRGDRPLWVIVFFLSLFSIMVVYSSSFSETVMHDSSTTRLLIEQIIFLAVGWTAMIICYYIPPYMYKNLAKILFWICCGLLIYALAFGATVNGTSRWIKIAGFTIQPSEFTKISLVLYLAAIIDRYNLDDFKTYVRTILIPVGIMLFLILVNSVSMTVLLTIVAACLLLFNGMKWKFIWKTLVIAIAALGIAWAGIFLVEKVFDYKIGLFSRIETVEARFERFLSNEEKEVSEMTREEQEELKAKEEKEFQRDMSQIAIKSGGLTGKGPGHSTQKYILPQANSDFVYSIIIEEYGILFGLFILGLYVTIFIRCVRIANRCTRKFSAATVMGLGTGITLQAMLHMMVNVGLVPVTGQTLPFLSSGGTSYFVMCIAMGIIQSVSKAANDQYLSRKEQEKAIPIEAADAPAEEIQEETEAEPDRKGKENKEK